MPRSETKFEIEFLADYSDEAILAEICRVALMTPQDKPLSQKTFNALAPKVAHSTIRRRFGGWKEALQRAGIAERYGGPDITERMKSQNRSHHGYPESELVAELQRVYTLVGKAWLSSTDFDAHSVTSHGVIGKHFGSFAKGLLKAGIPNHPLGKLRTFTDEECFENIADLWAHYGRAPQYRELLVPPSTILGKTYMTRWGTWRRTLIAFVEWANSGAVVKEEQEGIAHSQVDDNFERPFQKITRNEANVRDIRPGLRFKVFRRDLFHCVACGRSPATHLNTELHADHILAVANGGKTTFENLQTLCQDCNLGKGKS